MPDPSLLLLVVVAIAGTYSWRFGGVLVAGRVKEGSPFFVWVSCVGYAIAAGLMMKLLVLPTGTLASSTLNDRVIAFVLTMIVFFLVKRRIAPALAVGVGSFYVLLWLRTAT
jgi:branched-subunit amino acid transport protein